MMRTPLWLVGIVLLLASSCAPKRSEIRLDTAATTSTVLVNIVKEHETQLVSITGRGILSFDSPENSGSVSFESVLKRSDSLLVTLQGPFGVNVGTFFLSKEKYILYNRFENTTASGNPKYSSIRSIIPFDLSSEQILSAFAGVFALPSDPNDLRSYSIDDGMFLLVYACGANTCKFWIDQQYLLASRYEVTDAAGVLILEAHASSFTSRHDVAAARRISFSFPAQERELSIAYTSMSINETDLDFRFTIPANARSIVR